jgi:hypothetical protein
MTAEVKPIRPGLKVEEKTDDVCPKMVEFLEKCLDDAKAGRLRSFSFAGELMVPGEETPSVVRAFDVASTGSKLTLLAAMRLSEHALLKSWDD